MQNYLKHFNFDGKYFSKQTVFVSVKFSELKTNNDV